VRQRSEEQGTLINLLSRKPDDAYLELASFMENESAFKRAWLNYAV